MAACLWPIISDFIGYKLANPMTQALFLDVLEGYEFSTAGCAMGQVRAMLSLERGTVHLVGGDGVETWPEDLGSGPYLALPGKAELGLGRDLAIAFAEAHMPGHVHTVEQFFRQRGAYGRFKAWLETQEQLQAWYDYEAVTTEVRLRQWCAEQSIELR